MNLEDTINYLRHAGHKITPQRVVIIQTVLESTELLTPSALYEKVRQADPQIGEVTVYRTLNILSDLGLVCMVNTGDNTHSYIGRPAEHHGHLICSDCGKVVNFTGCDITDLAQRLTTETGFTIYDHRLDFFGKCRECSQKNQRGDQL